MRLLVINFIALIIAITSLNVRVDASISYYEHGSDGLSSLPILDLQPIRNPNNKSSHDVDSVSQSLTELLEFVSVINSEIIPFLYYLPIYSLNRAKVYFLLI